MCYFKSPLKIILVSKNAKSKTKKQKHYIWLRVGNFEKQKPLLIRFFLNKNSQNSWQRKKLGSVIFNRDFAFITKSASSGRKKVKDFYQLYVFPTYDLGSSINDVTALRFCDDSIVVIAKYLLLFLLFSISDPWTSKVSFDFKFFLVINVNIWLTLSFNLGQKKRNNNLLMIPYWKIYQIRIDKQN